MNIRLCTMTKNLMRQFFQGFTYDPDTQPANTPYVYSQEQADAFYEKHNRTDRVHFAIMHQDEIVGDLYLKQIDPEKHCCTMSIHMKNDSVKNRGYGTCAEQLALKYAFQELDITCVYADTLNTNTRSQHVLKKVGFKEVHRDTNYTYYVCHRFEWQKMMLETSV